MADEQPVNEKPVDESADEQSVDIYGRPIKYISDEARRAAEKNLNEEEAAKFIVQEATPSSGGVFPPSAIVTPFSADVVAAHTPGEKAAQEKSAQPATETTPA